MNLINDMKRLVDHIVTVALIKSTVNDSKLTNSEKVNKILIHLNELDRNLLEVQDEKTKI